MLQFAVVPYTGGMKYGVVTAITFSVDLAFRLSLVRRFHGKADAVDSIKTAGARVS